MEKEKDITGRVSNSGGLPKRHWKKRPMSNDDLSGISPERDGDPDP